MSKTALFAVEGTRPRATAPACGSRPNVCFDGETLLIYAARLGREQELLALVADGADITARDAKGRTVADHARRKRLPPAVLAVLGGPRDEKTTHVG